MSKKSYRVVINGMRTALQLTEDEARRRGLTQVATAPAPTAPAKRAARGKQVTPKNKAAAKAGGSDDSAPVEASGLVPDLDGKGKADGAAADAGK